VPASLGFLLGESEQPIQSVDIHPDENALEIFHGLKKINQQG
jgi:hypothetical protein